MTMKTMTVKGVTVKRLKEKGRWPVLFCGYRKDWHIIKTLVGKQQPATRYLLIETREMGTVSQGTGPCKCWTFYELSSKS